MSEFKGTIELIGGITPKNNGDFPLVTSKDVEVPGKKRLTDVFAQDKTGRYIIDESYTPKAYELSEGMSTIDPDKYYVFGEVDELSVTLNDTDDGRVHEYIFEFIPSANFTTLTINPEPKWVNDIQIVPGKIHQVSIVRGIGVMICA